MKFDVLIVNPPYQGNTKLRTQGSKRRGTGSVYYYKYIVGIINNVDTDGYLLSVHPRGWRRPCNVILNRIKLGTLHFCKMYDKKECKRLFSGDVQVAVDYVFWQNKTNATNATTTINDARHITTRLNINEWPFLPNYNFSLIDRLLAKNDKCLHIIKYENRRDYRTEADDAYNIECIHSITKDGTRYAYTNPNAEAKWRQQSKDLKYPLVLISHSQGSTGIRNAIILTEYQPFTHQMNAFEVDNMHDAINLKSAIETDFFKTEILRATLYGNFMVPHHILKYFKYNIWEYVNEYR